MIIRKMTFAAAVFCTLLMTACGSDSTAENKQEAPKKEMKEQPAQAAEDAQGYEIDKSAIKVGWTAYKFTERTGVSGVFEQIKLESSMKAQSIPMLLTNVPFSIPVLTINSKDPVRDKKLTDIFFATMKNTTALEGKVLKAEGNDNKGTCQVLLRMNEQEREVPMTYEVTPEGVLEVGGVLDINNWKAEEAVSALNEACKVLHTGKDGVSKLWPDVKVLISLPLAGE